MQPFSVGSRPIGDNHPVYVVAELSANHGQDFRRAKEMVAAAAQAGADAIKLQTYTAQSMTIDHDGEPFRIKGGTIWDGMPLYQLYQQAHTPWSWHAELKAQAEALGMDFFSTPFDPGAVSALQQLGVLAYKVASFELVDDPLLEAIGHTGRPVVMSTGMSTLDEIQHAYGVLKGSGAPSVALLKCTSAYPALPESMNLATLPDLAARFGCVVGLSDHSLGIAAAVTSVALGGRIIEKHFTLSRTLGGADAEFSLEPDEFRQMVDAVRTAQAALGEIAYGPAASEKGTRNLRRSIFVVRDLARGETFTEENIRCIRPGYGLSPRYYRELIGLPASMDLTRGTPLQWKHVG